MNKSYLSFHSAIITYLNVASPVHLDGRRATQAYLKHKRLTAFIEEVYYRGHIVGLKQEENILKRTVTGQKKKCTVFTLTLSSIACKD
jgi:hypothetical protein